MIKLLLVRHGESVMNLEKRFQGSLESPLSEKGKQEAKKLALYLKDTRIDAIYSSDMERAVETAKEVAKFHGLKIIRKKELNERNFGALQGKYFKDLTEEEKEMNQRRLGEVDYRLPGGESLADVRERVMKIVDYIIENHKDQTVAIIVHGNVKRAMMLGILNKDIISDLESRYNNKLIGITVPNASITEIDIEDDKVELTKFISTKHL